MGWASHATLGSRLDPKGEQTKVMILKLSKRRFLAHGDGSEEPDGRPDPIKRIEDLLSSWVLAEGAPLYMLGAVCIKCH